MSGTAATPAEAERFALFLLHHVARLNHDKGWALQLHLGPFRDPNRAEKLAWFGMSQIDEAVECAPGHLLIVAARRGLLLGLVVAAGLIALLRAIGWA